MINQAHMPTKYKEFSAMKKALNEKQRKQNEKFLNLLNRFMYRYRMANAFVSINAIDVEKRTVDGYSCGMKLFMAYSAYDELRGAEKFLLKSEYLKTHKLRDKVLATKIRQNTEMRDLLLETITIEGDGLRRILRNFYEEKNDEVMCFATCLRHSFVHGDFTAARAGLTNKKRISVINEVTEVVLKVSDELFSEILA